MTRLLAALAALVAFGFGGAAQAQFYVGAHGGGNFVHDSDLDDPLVSEAEASLDAGLVVGGVAGYRFDLRQGISIDLESEITYRNNDIDEIEVGGSVFDASGGTESYAFLVNGWFNWQIGDSRFVPHIGGGIGALHASIDDPEIASIDLGEDDDTVLAGQIGTGIAYRLDRHIAVSLDYRFFVADDPKFGDTEVEYQNQSVMIGFKYLF